MRAAPADALERHLTPGPQREREAVDRAHSSLRDDVGASGGGIGEDRLGVVAPVRVPEGEASGARGRSHARRGLAHSVEREIVANAVVVAGVRDVEGAVRPRRQILPVDVGRACDDDRGEQAAAGVDRVELRRVAAVVQHPPAAGHRARGDEPRDLGQSRRRDHADTHGRPVAGRDGERRRREHQSDQRCATKDRASVPAFSMQLARPPCLYL